MGDSSQGSQKKGGDQAGFFRKLFAVLFGTDDPDREKRRQLKTIAQDLSRQRYRFYKPRTGEALGALSRFFFEIYRVIGPAQTLLQGSDSSNALKAITIDCFLSPDQEDAQERFSEAAIREAASTQPLDQVAAEVKAAVGVYLSGFTPPVIKQINDVYTLIQQLVDFVRFDYYFMLRKFDSSLLEGNYSKPPRSEAINAEYISDDLKDFLEVVLPLDADGDWDKALDVLREYRNVEVVAPGPWNKLLNTMASVVRSGVLVQIVRHVDRNPAFLPMARSEQFNIVQTHLNTLKSQVESHVQKLIHEVRGQKVQKLADAVFGAGYVPRTRNYTDTANAEFARAMVAGFRHTEALNYLAAFLLDYFVTEVRPVVSELLIVRATWADAALSSELSEAFYAVAARAEDLRQFDASLADDGELGSRLKRAAGASNKDSGSVRVLRQIAQDIDERALEFITDSSGNLIIVGRIVKTLIHDSDLANPEIILNWRELESLSAEPLQRELVTMYKKIYYFIQLMQMLVKK